MYYSKNINEKLFLCSDDIQIGDTVFCEPIHEANLKVPEAALNPYKEIKDDLELKLMRLIKCPKVIGEIITPGIKEGHVFTRDQFECVWMNDKGETSYYRPDVEDYITFDQTKLVVKIK